MAEVPPVRLEFDYSVWSPDTVIDLVAVPWDAGYRDLVRFESEAARLAWFDSRRASGQAVRLTNLVYLRYGEPVRLPLPFSQCNHYNYLVARNPIQPVPSRSDVPPRVPDTFYYFITGVEYAAPNCTLVTVQLDVWQTYYNRIEFGRSYIVRGHIAMANSNCTMARRSEYLLEPEGLEMGAEYDTVNVSFDSLSDPQVLPWLMCVSTTDLASSFGTSASPRLTTATGSAAGGIVSGCNVWFVALDDVEDFFDQLSPYPWVSQGIIMCCVLPFQMCPVNTVTVHRLGGSSANVRIYEARPQIYKGQNLTAWNLLDNFRIPARYAGLKKLYTWPYTAIEVTTYQGNPLILKTEFWRTDENGSGLLGMGYSLLPTPVIKIWPENYNNAAPLAPATTDTVDGTGTVVTPDFTGGEFLDMQTEMGDFVQVPVVNNMYQNYLASTANQRAYQFEAASWAQQKSLTAAQNAATLATAGMDTARANQATANTLSYQQLAIAQEQNLWSGAKGVASGLAGAAGSLISRDLGGTASGVASAAVSGADAAFNAEWMSRSNANQVGAANTTLANNLALHRQTADANLAYARFAAKGDYQQSIQAINATVQDARITQPSVSGQFGGNGFMWANGLVGITIKWKRLKMQYLVQLGEYFFRYGYYVNRFLVPPADLRCMDKFTYWQMQETVVFGALPEEFRQTIRGIFETGCTVWTNPDYIGRIDYADNEPLEGVSY